MSKVIPLPKALQELFAEIEGDLFGPKTGYPIRFSLKPGQHTYLFYRGPRGEQYCYTPHPDTGGNFWAWTYQPIGKGARSGKPTKWKMNQLVRCARHGTARNKALRRWRKARE